MKHSQGFTVIELIITIIVLGAASLLFFVQRNNLEVAYKDEQRKTSINAIYYGLEEVYFKENNSYPLRLSAEALPSVAPEQLLDTNGVAIGEAASEYRYEPSDCTDNACQSYSLRTTLQNEADFIKTQRNND